MCVNCRIRRSEDGFGRKYLFLLYVKGVSQSRLGVTFFNAHL
jgi:hypothetical protein